MTEKSFFWRFAMLPIILPLISIGVIWLLDDLVEMSGVFAGILTFLAASGVIGGVPYLVTLGIVFIFTRFFVNDDKRYLRIALLMPVIFVLVMHMSVLILSMVDDLKAQRTETRSLLQMNMDFLALDLLSFFVAGVYTLLGFIVLAQLRKKNRLLSAER